MKRLIQYYNKFDHHYLLTHHPWLWEMKVVEVGKFALAYNAVVIIDLLMIQPGSTHTSLSWMVLLSFISLFAFAWWLYQQRSHNLIKHYGETHKDVGRNQFWVYFTTITLLFGPPFLLYLFFDADSSPFSSTYLTNTCINIGIFVFLSFYTSMSILLWKLIGLSKFSITVISSILSALSIILIFKVDLAAFFIPIFCFIVIILSSVKAEWELKMLNDQYFIPITYIDIFIHVLTPVFYFIGRLIVFFIPIVIVTSLFNINFIDILSINVLLSLSFTLRKYATKTFPSFRKEYLSYASRPKP